MRAKKLTKETVLQLGVTDRGFPQFSSGDAVRVAQRIKEGDKERIQYFEGDVIAIHHNGVSSTFTVRRIGANGVAVERIFPFYSPKIESIEFIREGDVCRAKLYYMRGRIGKRARVKEKIRTHEEKEAGVALGYENAAPEAATDVAATETPVEERQS
ncbi:MAG: 50S ribosomal protein L19 [Candidatus Babeliaceae bacterium]|nr:50S ribosomal protein L19 [Candidatus Babeliaceae bacterium]